MIKKATYTTPPHAVICITCVHALKLFTEAGHGKLDYLCMVNSEKNDGVYCEDYRDSLKFTREIEKIADEGII